MQYTPVPTIEDREWHRSKVGDSYFPIGLKKVREETMVNGNPLKQKVIARGSGITQSKVSKMEKDPLRAPVNGEAAARVLATLNTFHDGKLTPADVFIPGDGVPPKGWGDKISKMAEAIDLSAPRLQGRLPANPHPELEVGILWNLEKFMEIQGVTVYDLMKLTDISYQNITNIAYRNFGTVYEKAEKIARALGYTVEELRGYTEDQESMVISSDGPTPMEPEEAPESNSDLDDLKTEIRNLRSSVTSSNARTRTESREETSARKRQIDTILERMDGFGEQLHRIEQKLNKKPWWNR